jgi:hypothetical protein
MLKSYSRSDSKCSLKDSDSPQRYSNGNEILPFYEQKFYIASPILLRKSNIIRRGFGGIRYQGRVKDLG